jgi:outer membrane protein
MPDKQQEDLRGLKDELDKQSMMLSMDAKEDKEKEFERKRREFKFLYEDLSEEMRKVENDARKKILEELEKMVMDMGKKGNYLLIFERRSSGIMSLDKAIDITDDVIKAYNKTKQ